MAIEERTISLLVNNQPGVLSRIAGVFSSRGDNIRSLSVAETTKCVQFCKQALACPIG